MTRPSIVAGFIAASIIINEDPTGPASDGCVGSVTVDGEVVYLTLVTGDKFRCVVSHDDRKPWEKPK